MTSDENQQQPQHGAWQPTPQGGDYDADATAFVQLPEGLINDLALFPGESPLAAPGHGYVPPMIVPLTPATDTGGWQVPPEPAPAASPEEAVASWPQQPQADPGATGHWTFPEFTEVDAAVPVAGADDFAAAPATGDWTVPAVDGDLPEEYGEFTTSGSSWGAQAPASTGTWTPDLTMTAGLPATLPGGAPAPWATPEPGAAQTAAAPVHETEYESVPGAHTGQHPGAEAHAAPGAAATQGVPGPHTAPDAQAAAEASEPPAAAAYDRHEPDDAPPAPDAEATRTAPGSRTLPNARAAAGASESPAAPEALGAQAAHGAPEQHTVPEAQAAAEASVPLAAPAADEPHTSPEAQAEPESPAAVAAHETPDAPEAHETPQPQNSPEPQQAPDALPDADASPAHEEHPLVSYVLRVNGADRPVTDSWIGESLLYVLRERLGLAGAKDGCSQGECGACNVQVDGRLVASCLVPAATAAGSEVRTVEGLAVDGEPSDVQRALADCGAVQCGFCIPGMAMTIHDLLEGNHAPTDLEARQALCGNLCRCSGYQGALEAVRQVVAEREAAGTVAAPEVADGEPRIPHQAPPGEGGVQAPHTLPHPQHPHDGGTA
ncbi:(2Fe-2S)-binding protein [Streptomyces sannanensis]|uniref:(2Fe-2S)-binding protein n=1 Tax=Streptomyces sannanensis TaxID=285536 RepID=A0ABP6SAA5_9ACTN